MDAAQQFSSKRTSIDSIIQGDLILRHTVSQCFKSFSMEAGETSWERIFRGLQAARKDDYYIAIVEKRWVDLINRFLHYIGVVRGATLERLTEGGRETTKTLQLLMQFMYRTGVRRSLAHLAYGICTLQRTLGEERYAVYQIGYDGKPPSLTRKLLCLLITCVLDSMSTLHRTSGFGTENENKFYRLLDATLKNVPLVLKDANLIGCLLGFGAFLTLSKRLTCISVTQINNERDLRKIDGRLTLRLMALCVFLRMCTRVGKYCNQCWNYYRDSVDKGYRRVHFNAYNENRYEALTQEPCISEEKQLWSANSVPGVNVPCLICYSPEASEPTAAHCGHIFCWKCILQWCTSSMLSDKVPLCPLCREKSPIEKLLPLYHYKPFYGLNMTSGISCAIAEDPVLQHGICCCDAAWKAALRQ